MPNRIIRPGINDSERVNTLGWPEEVFYRRLLNLVDDHGLCDARPQKLRADLYPLRLDRVREADISRWLTACEKAGLIVLYEAAGKPYLWVLDTRWQVRSEPKFPPPSPEVVEQVNLRAGDISCAQLRTKTKALSETETETKGAHSRASPQDLPDDLATPELSTAWADWIEHRRQTHKPVTQKSAEMSFRKLRELGPDRAVRAIEHSIASGYQGIFESNGAARNGKPKATPAGRWAEKPYTPG